MIIPKKEEEDEEETKTILWAYKPVFSQVLGMVLKATIELGVFDALASADTNVELTVEEIAGKLHESIDENGVSMLERMLEVLASHSVLSYSYTTDRDGRSWKRYGLTPRGFLMANREERLSFAPLLLLNFHIDTLNCWHYLKEAVKEGVNPFKRTHGMSLYEYMVKNPNLAKIFNEAMENQSNLVMKDFINKYMDGFMQINTLVDVGGGTGATLGRIVSAFPHIKGVNFDLSQVISKNLSLSGVEHVGGDMFDVIPSGDAILLKLILHNWNDERCLEILKNCWRALPTAGKVIIMEYVLPESPDTNDANDDAYDLSMIMMVLFDGAKERTEKEFQMLAKAACFSEFKISCKSLNLFLIELVK